MKARMVAAATFTAALAFVMIPANAGHDVTAQYLIATGNPVGSVVCCGGTVGAVMQDAGVGIGGFQFPAINEVPDRVEIEDLITAKGDHSITVCQVQDPGEPTDPPKTCGDPGTVSFSACTNSNGRVNLSNRGLIKDVQTAVFVDLIGTDCVNNAFSGTITMTYE